ncbi:MAG TPA: triose-phosphate isomerase [Actinobacteria bacterium]|nr:triose-phosphate isomerase [Actinomycetota bacterium]
MRKPMIAGNWKMYKTAGQAVFIVQDLAELIKDVKDVEVIVCPSYIALKSVSTVIEMDKLNMGLGAQNVYWEEEGAFTGEVSPMMLKDLRVDYVIVGHSERRHIFGETNEMVNKKLKAVLAHDMKPILCVGETKEEREEERTDEVIKEQLFGNLAEVSLRDIRKVVIAYEPVWAIGTGLTASSEDANDIIQNIRALIESLYGSEVAEDIRILYGGSVKPENITELMEEQEIDGALVGGASLDAQSFAKIVKYQSAEE